MKDYIHFFWAGDLPPYHVLKNIKNWQRHLRGSDFTVNLWLTTNVIEELIASRKILNRGVCEKLHISSYFYVDLGIVVSNFDELLFFESDYSETINLYCTFITNKLFQFASDIARVIILAYCPGIYLDVDVVPNPRETFPQNLFFFGWLMRRFYLEWDYYTMNVIRTGRGLFFESQIMIATESGRMEKLLGSLESVIRKMGGIPFFQGEIEKYKCIRYSKKAHDLDCNPLQYPEYVKAFCEDRIEYEKMNRGDGILLVDETYLEFVYQVIATLFERYLRIIVRDVHFNRYIKFYYSNIATYFISKQSNIPLYSWGNPGYSRLCDYKRSALIIEEYCFPRILKRRRLREGIQPERQL